MSEEKKGKCKVFSTKLQYFDDDRISHVMIIEPKANYFQGISIVTTFNNVTHVMPQSKAIEVLKGFYEAGYYTEDQYHDLNNFIGGIWDGQDMIYEPPQRVQVPSGFMKSN